MISVQEATNHILRHPASPGTEHVQLEESPERILREDLIADRPFPPFDRVTMDGIAIDFNAWKSGARTFPIQDIAAAGVPQKALSEPGNCIEVMTGAVLPAGCDTVIRYEDLTLTDRQANITIETIQQGQNIHRKGSDCPQGDVLVRAGIRIGFPEIGVAGTIGKSELLVARKLRIAIVSTGDELVPVSSTPAPHQIRMSNVYQIRAMLESKGVTGTLFHLADDKADTEQQVKLLLRDYDGVVLSGGVSAGKYDYVPDALKANGVVKVFHKIAQRPGKPFWFGVHPEGKTVFALPGNPVSSFMCTIRYVLPWIDMSYGIDPVREWAVLQEDFSFKPPLTYFLQVTLTSDDRGILRATPVDGHGSGDLANLSRADAFIELPEGKDLYAQGGVYHIYRFR